MIGNQLKLELLIPPQWARVDRVRQAVTMCVAAVFADTDLEDALAMTSAELLENAIKYGSIDGDRIVFSMFHDGEEVTIQVTNTSSPAATRALEERLAWIASFSSAEQAYATALAGVADRAQTGDASSGLGLVRIAYEGGCSLTFNETQGRVSVRAQRVCEPPLSRT